MGIRPGKDLLLGEQRQFRIVSHVPFRAKELGQRGTSPQAAKSEAKGIVDPAPLFAPTPCNSS
jgi:hypothetical protein